MDKQVRSIDVSLARQAVMDAGLYPVPRERLEEVVNVATEAYWDYPLHKWFAGGQNDWDVIRTIMNSSIKPMAQDALIYADSEQLNGFAVWLPRGFSGTETLAFLANGGLHLVSHGTAILKRLRRYEDFAMALKKKYTGHADWYLYNLTVTPKAQGMGIASKLLRPMLAFCDRQQEICYLETNKDTNVGLYEHYGFQLREQCMVPGSEIRHYAMTREPIAIK